MAEFDIMYNTGISRVGDVIDLATKYEITRKNGAFYNYQDVKLGQGRENVKHFLKNNEKVAQSIEKELQEFIYKMKEESAGDINGSFCFSCSRKNHKESIGF